MQQSSATLSLHLWFLGVAEDCCMLSILLAVPSCFNSFWHGVIPTSYFIFNDFYTCIYCRRGTPHKFLHLIIHVHVMCAHKCTEHVILMSHSLMCIVGQFRWLWVYTSLPSGTIIQVSLDHLATQPSPILFMHVGDPYIPSLLIKAHQRFRHFLLLTPFLTFQPWPLFFPLAHAIKRECACD